MKRLVAVAGLLMLTGSAGATEMSPSSPPSFAAPKHYGTSARAPQSVAIGDLNGDGKPDLVASHGYGDPYRPLSHLRAVSVLLNRGAGTFGAARAYPTGRPGDVFGAWSVAIGDLNGDGTGDLATANPGGRSVSVLLNRGGGTFLPSVSYAIGREPWDVAIVDVNGDGRSDVVTANPNTVTVLLNAGDGTLGPKLEYATGRPSDNWALAVGDLNNDARPDLVTANQRRNAVTVLMNRGEGFESFKDYPTGAGPRAVAIGDMNGDGEPDLVTANGSTGGQTAGWFDSVSVLLNRGDGSFRPRTGILRKECNPGCGHRLAFTAVVVGDLNGDHRADVATVNQEFAASLVSVFANKGGGRLRRNVDYGPWTREKAGVGARAVAIGDLNGDRQLDLVTPLWRSVSVLVNKPGRCTVQDVGNEQLAAARRMLVRANCRVGAIRYVKKEDWERGYVLSQRPRGGTVLPARSPVDLAVGR
jgi:FG-GAP-like repeat/FG-GAP repeat